ncbi:MAG TPA: Lrp/AsnC ligand binding domain-containing protein [Methanotrichaceae archaeon]|nr:Lrp/AsnC ligand binding domain-containing protein [Methanotrichaceae archaeon]
MIIGVAMLKVVPGQERSVYHALKKRDDIKDVYHVFGEYDFFVVTQAEGFGQLSRVIEDIQDINSVTAAENILIGRGNGDGAISPEFLQGGLT